MSYPIAACVGITIGFIFFLIAANIHNWIQLRRQARNGGTSDIEQRFRNAYAVMTEERRQSLVRYYMGKHECDVQSAMRFAMDDRAHDSNRWAS